MKIVSVIDARKESWQRLADEAAAVLQDGGVIVFPTDTVYGIGCDPFRTDAIDRIYGAKKRPDSKPLSLHVASVAEFLEYVHGNAVATLAARRLMPGPVTIIVRRPAFIDEDVSAGLPTLGFRVPDDALCVTLLERIGPVAATSANTSGERPYLGGGDIQAVPEADLLIEGGVTKYGAESSVIDLSGPVPRLLREGVLKLDYLSERLGPVVRHTVKVRNTQ
ncbi:MAG: threonylcarbamoyl-AMP synthase [Candidatus Meridianibacter frigidus]|nr:MAG: threonylcarbamoyl-AMP synthase [Candidatus Eremiobacteraeota bacterium]